MEKNKNSRGFTATRLVKIIIIIFFLFLLCIYVACQTNPNKLNLAEVPYEEGLETISPKIKHADSNLKIKTKDYTQNIIE